MAVVGINNVVYFGIGKELVKTNYGYHIVSAEYPLRPGQDYDHCLSTYGVISIGPRPAQDQTLEYAELSKMTKAIESGLRKMIEGGEDEPHRNSNQRKVVWDRDLYSR